MPQFARGSMTRRHFESIAAALKEDGASEEQARKWAQRLAQTNPRFDKGRFMRAAGHPDYDEGKL